MQKKLYRLKYDSKICGVCGGIGKFLNIDATLIRLIWIVVSVFTSGVPGVLAYFICAVVIPEEPADEDYRPGNPSVDA
ncbi:MAG: PspC domain-containing protein [Clostridiales bacterium]|jgi:phage shock protein C|nr:PspC domain-containing protein [Clostridiales bacterium]